MLMKTFPAMTEERIMWELDGDKGWAMYSWARENQASVWGSGERRTSPGYVKQQLNYNLSQKKK